jgi:hypothetical protein
MSKGHVVVKLLEEFEDSEHFVDDDDVKDQLTKLLQSVQKGYEDQIERSDSIQDYWDIYGCRLNDHQFYSGTSKIYMPLVHNALDARQIRFTNQLFPQNRRHVECLTTDGHNPEHILVLVEHYISALKMRTKIVPKLCISGDVEGQYSVYVSWKKFNRKIKRRIKMPMDPATGEAHGDDQEALSIEKVVDGSPHVEVLPDSDILILPVTAASVDDALGVGGSVTVIRRWSKSMVRQMAKDGAITEDAAEGLTTNMDDIANKIGKRNQRKANVEKMGMKTSGKEIEVFETWTMLWVPVDGKTKKGEDYEDEDEDHPGCERVLCQVFMRGDASFLGCRENPYWNGRCPIISEPVKPIEGSARGESKVKYTADMQYAATDSVNIAMDSANYSLNPIVLTDPTKNPRVSSMVLNMAAIWETSPNDTKIIEFPQLWQQGFEIASVARSTILETANVSGSAITQQGKSKKPTQADVANEQQIDILTTNDAVIHLEESILTPIVQWFVDLDYQYRDRDLLIRKYGKMGTQAIMQRIEPLQMNEAYEVRWFGVEASRTQQQMQQQIAGLNILRGIPPQMHPGYEVDLAPALALMVENLFGPRIAPLLFKPLQDSLSMPIPEEQKLLAEGFDVPISPLDNHQEHIAEHMKLGAITGDPKGNIRVHMQNHMMALQAQQVALAARQNGIPGQPGTPGGAGKGTPGSPGQPRAGAQPMRSPTGSQQPPGGIPAGMSGNAARSSRLPRGNAA